MKWVSNICFQILFYCGHPHEVFKHIWEHEKTLLLNYQTISFNVAFFTFIIIKYGVFTVTGLLLTVVLGVIILTTSSSSSNPSLEKGAPFECGFLGLEESRSPFRVHFFLISLIFLVFDVELVIIFPYLSSLGPSGQYHQELGLLIFVFVLLLGLIVE